MKPLIIANWKQYVDAAHALPFFNALVSVEKKGALQRATLVVAAPVLTLPLLAQTARATKTKIKLAAQDCGTTDTGAHTGAVSPKDLKKCGASYVIIGHSERRTEYGETDELIAQKISAALAAKLTPIVCVGETASERAAKKTNTVIEHQVRAACAVTMHPEKLVFAYEPRWAIGAGTPVEPEEASRVHALIQKIVGTSVVVCYGGSVTSENIHAFVHAPQVAGALVGGASKTIASLRAIIQNI